MNLAESVNLAKAIKDGSGAAPAEVVLCPPFTALTVVGEILKGSVVRLGAQDVCWEAQGAFTGEISAPQLGDCGCRYVIIGHSERRRLFGEADWQVQKKIKAALGVGLAPIMCVGETLDEREEQKTYRVLQTQLEGGLKEFAPAQLAQLVIAYEPVWAIGTGKTATPDQAQQSHLFIRKTVARLYSPQLAAGLRLLYGGSVKAENVDALMARPDIDGALVGGDSLKQASFLRIIHFKAPSEVG